jgi:hypothetical protein
MKRQMVVKLSQMNTWAERLQDRPKLLEPAQAALTHRQITGNPTRRNPRLPNSVTVVERGETSRYQGCGTSQLLTRQAA